jgi:hypothetical protein
MQLTALSFLFSYYLLLGQALAVVLTTSRPALVIGEYGTGGMGFSLGCQYPIDTKEINCISGSFQSN